MLELTPLILLAAMAPLAVVGLAAIIRRIFRIVRDRRRTRRTVERFTMDDRDKFGIAEVYKDKAGRRWYAFTNAARMPAVRAIYCEVAMRQSDMNLTRPMLEELLNKTEDFLNTGKFVDAAHMFSEIKARMNEACEEKTLLALASYYFVVDGEDPTTVVDDWMGRKQQIWNEDEECRTFFLLASYRLTNKLSAISESDILAYLAEAATRRHQSQPLSTTTSSSTSKQ